MSYLRLLILVLLLLAAGSNASSQQNTCAPLTLSPGNPLDNMFTAEQEVALGDVAYQQLSEDYKIIDDPELTSYIQQIADRIASYLPMGGLQSQVVLMDLPEANAFSLPGGRMMFSRKLISLARTEDELASVVAHELGHIVTHQSAADTTRQMRKVLGIQSISSADEVYQRFHELLENGNRNPKVFREDSRNENEFQGSADRIGLEAMVRAGYDPNAFVDIFDRTVQLKGNTGNWWSNLWGRTPPDAKRLQENRRNVASLNPSCVDHVSTSDRAGFAQWQKTVAQYGGSGHVAHLRGVVDQRKLDPPLMPDIERFKFSQDGKYLLAQDETGIVVFTREPFKAKFRVDAAGAEAAQFTPDMKSIVFHFGKAYEAPRVEKWSLTDGTREALSDVHISGGCRQSELSPDGKTLLCVKDGPVGDSFKFMAVSLTFDLQLYDVESGEVLYEKKGFGRKEVHFFALWFIGALSDVVNAGFTPDSQFLMVSSGSEVLCFNLRTKAPVQLPGDLKSSVRGAFSFIGNDRVLGRGENSLRYNLLRFPSGEKLVRDMEFGIGRPTYATSGDYILVRPIKDFDVALYDVNKKAMFRAYKNSAMDVYDGYYVHQRADADVEIRDLEKHQVWDKAALPPTKVRSLRAAAASPDLTLFAASLKSRGAVWDIPHFKRLSYLRGFDGAYIPDESVIFAQFPKFDEIPPSITALNLKANNVIGQRNLDEKQWASQYSQYVLVNKLKDEKNPKKGANVEVHDVKSDGLLWTLPDIDTSTDVNWSFGELRRGQRYAINAPNGTLALWAVASTDKGKKLLQFDPDANSKLQIMRDKRSAIYLTILEMQTGKRLASLLLDTGKFSYSVEDATMVGDRIVINDDHGRVLLFDPQGVQKGRLFAPKATVSAAANLLCAHHGQGRIEVFELATLKKREELVFPESVTTVRLSGDGKRMLVLTADQTVYTLDLMKLSASSD